MVGAQALQESAERDFDHNQYWALRLAPRQGYHGPTSLRRRQMSERSNDHPDIHGTTTQINSIKIVGGVVLFVVILLAAYMTS
jgi:hypothetical protein